MSNDGIKIRKYLLDTEMTQTRFAASLELSRSYLNAILNGIYIPSDKIKRKLRKIIKDETLFEE